MDNRIDGISPELASRVDAAVKLFGGSLEVVLERALERYMESPDWMAERISIAMACDAGAELCDHDDVLAELDAVIDGDHPIA